MARVPGRMAAVLLLALPLLLSACAGSKPVRFYVLTPLAEITGVGNAAGRGIGVGPVVIPQYLDRPEIVTRSSDNRLDLAEFDQWGGRIGDNITRVLADNLSGLLDTDRISIYPWTDASSLADQVTVDITQFERDQSGAVTLIAFWSITDLQSGKVLRNGRSSIEKPVAAGGTGGYDSIAAAMSEALASLSQEIAAAIKAQPAS
ncbi:MAG TPA: PqiC family protein [Hypericibacter adhaerens]|uniref:PqiC family protein n=1 Tax=Hypericibacter adhaerens TaxID=2602016 RepID=UPI002BF94DDB|nr:PqiC family protein [Hypericibacter adhaerens]HWA43889.1 PqiC family protein [Hypericibacter adhaerens]